MIILYRKNISNISNLDCHISDKHVPKNSSSEKYIKSSYYSNKFIISSISWLS